MTALEDEKAVPADSSPRQRSRLRLFLDNLPGASREHLGPTTKNPVVALVTDAIFPYHCGGREIRYYELSRRLAGRAELHLYTMRWWDGPRVRKDEAVTFHSISRLYPMYTRNRRSLRQAIFFALACTNCSCHVSMYSRQTICRFCKYSYCGLWPL